MTFDPKHGHAALRRGRWSTPQAEYFLTFCTQERKPGLAEPHVIEALHALARQLEAERIWTVRTAVVMPDHIHMLVSPGVSNQLTSAVRLFKGRVSPLLRQLGLSWQKAYFDHRLREGEDVLPLFLYIFLNPYRDSLLTQNERWCGYYCSEEDWTWFAPLTNESTPFPEWLTQ